MDLDEQTESEEDCLPSEIIPGDEFTCIFDLNEEGDKKLEYSLARHSMKDWMLNLQITF